MNWYKKAKQYDLGEGPLTLPPQEMYYQDIGHEWDEYEENPVSLWAFVDGKLRVKKNIKPGENHTAIWGSEIEDTDYFGRIEHNTKKCSVVIPTMYVGRRIPNVILRALYDYFGNDIKIYEFD